MMKIKNPGFPYFGVLSHLKQIAGRILILPFPLLGPDGT
jgi:hypothetical protein